MRDHRSGESGEFGGDVDRRAEIYLIVAVISPGFVGIQPSGALVNAVFWVLQAIDQDLTHLINEEEKRKKTRILRICRFNSGSNSAHTMVLGRKKARLTGTK